MTHEILLITDAEKEALKNATDDALCKAWDEWDGIELISINGVEIAWEYYVYVELYRRGIKRPLF